MTIRSGDVWTLDASWVVSQTLHAIADNSFTGIQCAFSSSPKLSAWGAKIFEQPDGFHVEGPTPLKGGKVKTFHDHRIAMTLGIAGLISKLPATLDDPDCVDISYPGFFDELRGLIS